MKEKTSQWTSEDWIEAYEDMVRKATNYVGYSCSAKTAKLFDKLAEKHEGINPYLFIAANSPQYREWWTKSKGKWKQQKYPFPHQLYSEKCMEHYQKFLSKGIKTAKPRQEAIYDAVVSSQEVLKKCKVSNTDFQTVWDLYTTDYISPYYIVMLKSMRKWININMRSGEITMENKKVLDSCEKVLEGYVGLSNKLYEIMKG